MLFVLGTLFVYLTTTVAAILAAIFVSFVCIMPFASDDSPGLGLLWGMACITIMAVLIPLSLAMAAELIEIKRFQRKIHWRKVFIRFYLLIPSLIGPLYYMFYVWPFQEWHRPEQWILIEAGLLIISACFLYLGLKIGRPENVGPSSESQGEARFT